MPYNQQLADKLKSKLSGEPHLSERKMFGGMCYMINGNMLCGASSNGNLLLRVDPKQGVVLATETGVSIMNHGDRQMPGFLFLDRSIYEDDTALPRWLQIALEYVKTLPPKKP